MRNDEVLEGEVVGRRPGLADAVEWFHRAAQNAQDGDIENAADYAVRGLTALAMAFEDRDDAIAFVDSLPDRWRGGSA